MTGIQGQGKDKRSIKRNNKNVGSPVLIETKNVSTDEKGLANVQDFTTLPF